jgi:hypothetical protein
VISVAFELRGKFNGYPVLKCNSCGAGLTVKNAGRAMLTKKAKTSVIPGGVWQNMEAEWQRRFPNG